MGAQIAAHLANAGLPVRLFDVTPAAAAGGIESLKGHTHDPCFDPKVLGLIQTAGFDELALAAGADWIVEAVVESLEIKRDLLARLEPHAAAASAISSNTSGIPLHAIAEGRTDAFRRR